MAASQEHGVMVPASSASFSFQMESDTVPPPELADFAGFLEFKIDILEFHPATDKTQQHLL